MSNTDVGGAWGEPRPTTGSTPGSDTGGGSAKEKVAGAAQTVKQEAASFAGDARSRAVEKLEQQKETATRTLGDFANAIRRAGDELSQTDQSVATRLVRQAADGLESFARTVSDKRPEELLDVVRDFGRRNPTAFIAGSVLVGLAVGRFLTSSSSAATSAVSEPATFYGADGGAPDVGLSDPTLAEVGGSVSAAGLADPAALGATSIGAPQSSLDAESEIALGDPQGLGDEVLASEAEATESLDGGLRTPDTDRSRFGSGS